MTKQILDKLYKATKEASNDLDNGGRLPLAKQIALQETLAEVEAFLQGQKAPNKKATKKGIKKIKQLVTLLRRHLEPKGSLPYSRVVRLDKGKLQITDMDTVTTIDIDLWPELQEVAIEFDDFAKLSAFPVDSKVELTTQRWYTLSVTTSYSEHGIGHSYPAGDTFTTKQEAQEYFDKVYKAPDGMFVKAHSVNEHTQHTIVANGQEVTFVAEDWNEMRIPSKGLQYKGSFSLALDQLEAMVRVGTAACKDESRPVFQAVCLKEGRFIAADGYRMIMQDTDIHLQEGQEDLELLFPAQHLDKILKSLKALGESNDLTLTVYEKQQNVGGDLEHTTRFYEIESEKAVFQGQFIDGEFPNYRNIIPSRDETTVELTFGEGVGELLKIIATNHKKNDCANMFKIEVSPDGGKGTIDGASYDLPVKADKSGLTAFNIFYLSDTINALQGQIKGWFNVGQSGWSPLVLISEEQMGLIMPMHIKEDD